MERLGCSVSNNVKSKSGTCLTNGMDNLGYKEGVLELEGRSK
jgi:hypothetical protein